MEKPETLRGPLQHRQLHRALVLTGRRVRTRRYRRMPPGIAKSHLSYPPQLVTDARQAAGRPARPPAGTPRGSIYARLTAAGRLVSSGSPESEGIPGITTAAARQLCDAVAPWCRQLQVHQRSGQGHLRSVPHRAATRINQYEEPLLLREHHRCDRIACGTLSQPVWPSMISMAGRRRTLSLRMRCAGCRSVLMARTAACR